jgi:hypothetical protein
MITACRIGDLSPTSAPHKTIQHCKPLTPLISSVLETRLEPLSRAFAKDVAGRKGEPQSQCRDRHDRRAACV